MTKLRNKLETISSKETGNKRDTNFPFAILPKQRKTLQFNNKAIDNYLPTFGNLRHKTIPFNVPLKSHLKGLTLQMSKATKSKYFILRYWFQNKYRPYQYLNIKIKRYSQSKTIKTTHTQWVGG